MGWRAIAKWGQKMSSRPGTKWREIHGQQTEAPALMASLARVMHGEIKHEDVEAARRDLGSGASGRFVGILRA